MTRNQTLTTLVLLGAMLLVGTLTVAAELPAQDGRMWAPTGDVIGLENHATIGAVSWDPHGNKPKYAEDWQQEDDILFNGLFGFHTVLDNGRSILLRGYGESGRGTLASRLTLVTSRPGKCRVSLDFRNYNNFYDPTSEMRASYFAAPPAPPALGKVPSLGWRKGRIDFAYNLGRGFGLDLGFNRLCKDGDKASLLRGRTGVVANDLPNSKKFDTTTNEFLLGASYAGTSLDVAAKGSLRQAEGGRSLGDHTYVDDQTLFRLGLDATYRLSGGTSLLGAVSNSKLEAKNSEIWDGGAYSPTGEAKTTNGRLGLITHVGRATTARLTGGLSTWNTDHQTDLAGVMGQATTRERSGMDLGLLVTNTSLSKTRLRFDYRYRSTNLKDTVTDVTSGVPDAVQNIDQDRLSHRANLRAGIRLGRKTTLKAHFGWRSLTVDQANSGDDIFYTMGDRKQNRLSARLAVQTRPSAKVRLDVGLRGHDQSFEREDIADVKTTNTAHQAFVGLNIMASDRLTFVGTGSFGLEKYESEDGPTATADMGPLTYEGQTIRFAPGAILQVTDKLNLEAHYEGVRFEDPGDAPDEGNQLNSDLDRILVRAGYRFGKDMTVSATYRRHEFDENRWDDYIMDLYSLSVSGGF